MAQRFLRTGTGDKRVTATVVYIFDRWDGYTAGMTA
jgi:hypothetical protein